MTSYTFPTASDALPILARNLIQQGDEVGSRNGRVLEFLNPQIVLTDPQRREILTGNRKANVFAQIAETMWVLSGRNDIKWLSAYLPRAEDFSDDGQKWRGGYGPRIRGGHFGFDQLEHVLDLLREDPLTRRAVVVIYDPTTDAAPGKDIPCNDMLQFQSRMGALHMTVTVRSNDLMWGWSGINTFEWSTLQEIMAHLLGVAVGRLTFNIGSLHLYEPHWARAGKFSYDANGRVGYPIIPFNIPSKMDRNLRTVDELLTRWFQWEGLCREGWATPGLLDEIDEPLFQSWAAAIAYYWQREDHWLEAIGPTRLAAAITQAPVSVLPEPRVASRRAPVGQGHPLRLHERTRVFYTFVKDLHAEKHASYGDSWKKRGEKMSILPNMARKVDRIGVGDKYDSSADTVVDLLAYSVKYECWLLGKRDNLENFNLVLSHHLAETEEHETPEEELDTVFTEIVADFNHYCDNIDTFWTSKKVAFVQRLSERLAPIARDMWYREQQKHDGDDYRGADQD